MQEALRFSLERIETRRILIRTENDRIDEKASADQHTVCLQTLQVIFLRARERYERGACSKKFDLCAFAGPQNQRIGLLPATYHKLRQTVIKFPHLLQNTAMKKFMPLLSDRCIYETPWYWRLIFFHYTVISCHHYLRPHVSSIGLVSIDIRVGLY